MDVSTYTKEFFKLCIKAKTVEIEEEKLARYINSLKFSIQEELSLHNLGNVCKCYQMTLKVEEKFKRKQDHNNRDRGQFQKGRGSFRGKGNNGSSQENSNQEDNKGEGNSRGKFKGIR